MHSITLQHAGDFAGFRTAARALIRNDVPPDQVTWQTAQETASLFNDGSDADRTPATTFTVPAAYMRLAETVSMHNDPARFALLYRLLWRLRAEPRLLDVTMDADVAGAHGMAKSVDRDIHKMHAFVRFRQVPGVEPQTFIAWFEPQHHIVEAAAPFFVRRFANTPWAIVTPERRAIWDLHKLTLGPGGQRSEVPEEDAAESLWRDYYASIFNPARLKVDSMRAHMPKKYWRNLPESPLIPDLIAASRRRTQDMIDHSVTEPARRHQRRVEAVAAIQTIEEAPLDVRALAALCRSCPLWERATQTVFGEGPENARIVVIGEQPGDQEDIAGRPFVGPAGQLLDRALKDAGLNRDSLYVTNAVKHFKFEARGKRRLHKTPGEMEVAACHQWLEQELSMIQPDLILALGGTAARSVFGKAIPILKNRGRIFSGQAQDETRRPDILLSVHPSSLLRMPDSERAAAYDQFVSDLKLAVPYASIELPDRANA
ncbi:MAG: UdgX family uracil-DNA binding protein [Povalibacter sp.]